MERANSRLGKGKAKKFHGIRAETCEGKFHMNEEEAGFATKFARFINERNVLGFIEELERTSKDISQNANSSIALFDFTMKVIILLRK